MKVSAVLLAAGSGTRFGASRPKQLARLEGLPLFVHSLRVFAGLPFVKDIVVVVPAGREKFFERAARRAGVRRTLAWAPGGAFRGESVKNGLLALPSLHDAVLVHDTARPLVTAAIVRRVAAAARRRGVALAAWPLADTLKRADKVGRVLGTVPREGLWLAQTPQGFRSSVARECLLSPSPTATDDVELAQRRGHRAFVVPGEPFNMKVTYASDLALCSRWKAARS